VVGSVQIEVGEVVGFEVEGRWEGVEGVDVAVEPGWEEEALHPVGLT